MRAAMRHALKAQEVNVWYEHEYLAFVVCDHDIHTEGNRIRETIASEQHTFVAAFPQHVPNYHAAKTLIIYKKDMNVTWGEHVRQRELCNARIAVRWLLRTRGKLRSRHHFSVC